MKLEPGNLYRCKFNNTICFVLIWLGVPGPDSQDTLYFNGCKAFFPERGAVERVSIWCSDWEEL